MIIDTTYFQNDLYLAHAKPSLTSSITSVQSKVQDYIDDYVPDCLIRSLGSKLAYEFMATLDVSEDNGLKTDEASKWDDLLNGKSYTNPNGDEVVWRGIRYRSSLSNKVYNRSFLANYVFWFYESNDSETKGANGDLRIESKNSVIFTPGRKAVKAYRKFTDLVQGEPSGSEYFIKVGQYGGVGVDYFNDNPMVDLYKFINDSNKLVEDTYADFKPKIWETINQLGF